MLNIESFLHEWQASKTPQDNLAIEVLNSTHSKKVYAFGRNELTENLLRHIQLDGVIDDFYGETEWLNIPVFRAEELTDNPIIINCVLSIKPKTAWNKIQSLTTNGTAYFNFHKQAAEQFPLFSMLAKRKKDLQLNHKYWNNVWELLEDDNSRTIFNDFIKFSITGDYHWFDRYNFAPQEQYFESFMGYNKEVFVDAGGFIGDTSLEFTQRYPDYSAIYLFEPSQKNIQQAKLNLKHLKNIHFVEQGVSDSIGEMLFNEGLGSSSYVSEEGNTKVSLTTIDDAVKEPVSFIKMDLEGFEGAAIEGARQQIADNTPKLAIAVYHKGDDMWRLMQQVFQINNNYRIRLGHYTEGWSETIMYFLPKSER